MEIKVEKLTDVDLLRKCASFTSGKECGMSLLTAYRNKHSIIRSQIFVIEMRDIPLFVASQLVRSHVGVQWYMRSKRTDRGGVDFGIECFDFGQRIDIIAEQIDYNMSEAEVEGIVESLNDLEKEVKSYPQRFDRMQPTSLLGLMNSEAIMAMSEKRLCAKVSVETREIWERVLHEISKADPDLVKFCVMPCVANGGICREPKGCGFNRSEICAKQIEEYRKLFVI